MKKIEILKKAYIVYSLIAVIFLVVYLVNINKDSEDNYHMYKRYKNYEQQIDKKIKIINKEFDQNSNLYYKNSISKSKFITNIKENILDLEDVYNNFKWSQGDTLTKEMFVIKKQIILNYIKLKEKRYKCLEKAIKYTSTDEENYIKELEDKYNQKDKLEREKYNLPFDKK